MRKSDVIAYRSQLRTMQRFAEYNLDRHLRDGATEDDPGVQRMRGYVLAIDDAVEAFDQLRSARVASTE